MTAAYLIGLVLALHVLVQSARIMEAGEASRGVRIVAGVAVVVAVLSAMMFASALLLG